MSKKFTVYLADSDAKRLEAETSIKASPGAVIKNRLLASWHKEDTAPIIPRSIQTDSLFTAGGDEIKRHVSDNDLGVLAESNMKKPNEEPVSFCSPHHIQALRTINDKKGQRWPAPGLDDTRLS